jgi:transposase
MPRRKRSYRSVNVKGLDREKLAEAVRGKPLVFSIDVAKEKEYGTFMTDDRESHVTVRWDMIEETSDVMELLNELPASEIAVAMEPTGTYGDPLRWQLEKIGIPVIQVAAKRSHDAAEVYDGVPSYHDAKCAQIIGRLYWEGVGKHWKSRSEEERELNAAISVLEMHEGTYGKRRNQIEALLARHWPELTKYLDLGSVTILELLAEMGGPRAIKQEPGKAAELMRRVGRSGLSDWKIEAVLKSARETIGVPMIPAEETALKEIALDARRSQKLKREKQIQIERLVQEDEELSGIGDLVGKTTAAVFLAQLGPFSEYANAKSLEKAFGLNLKVKSSGRYKGHLKITKRGPSLPRVYLYLAVLRLIQHDPIVAAWYWKLVSRNGGIKKKAIVAVMRKLARALWYMARGEKFDSRKLFNVKLLKAQAA